MTQRNLGGWLRQFARGLFISLLWMTGVLVLLSIGGKVAYSSIVNHRCAQWEATVKRDPSGIRAGCESFTVGDGRTAILMIHGFGSSPAVFQRMAPALAELGYKCRVMRLPGYGMKPEQFASVDRSTWLAAIDHEVRELRKTSDQVWIVGHSMGASLALDYLLEWPGAANGVTLLAPLIEVSDARSPLLPTRAYYEIGRHVFGPSDLLESCFSEDFHTNEPVADPGREFFTPFAVFEQAFDLMDRIGSRARDFRAPMLMVLSREDKVVNYRASEKYFAKAASADKRLYFVKNAGHILPLDNGWQEIVGQIDSFIRDCPDAAPKAVARVASVR